MQTGDLIERLKNQGTWRLFLMGVLTLGIYPVFYLAWQTERLRQYLHTPIVSNTFITTLGALACFSAGMGLTWLFDSSSLYLFACQLAQLLALSMHIIWALRAGRYINRHYRMDPDSEYGFQTSWTLLFSSLYFNYKINQLNRLFDAPVMRAF